MGKYDFDLELNTKNTMSVINAWIPEGADVLELGSANGRLTKYLSEEKNCNVTIVEIDTETGTQASQYAKKAYVGPDDGDILKLKWSEDENAYDYVVIADVLEHLSKPDVVLQNCRKVLKKNGRVLVSIPNIAHNSVLIDLYNNQFIYSKTGLLDSTHIHFFTYHTFKNMAEAAGLHLMAQEPIYSRVGWNEIDNHYSDIPVEVEKELRYRRGGSVYQYVFNLSFDEQNGDALTLESIPILEKEYGKEAEISCFIWNSDTEEPAERKGQNYFIKNMNQCYIPLETKAYRLRLDLLEDSVMVKILSIHLEADGARKEVTIKHTNADFHHNNIFYFGHSDPWLELDITEFEDSLLSGLEVEFEILEYGYSDKQLKNHRILLDKIRNFDSEELKVQKELLEQENNWSKEKISSLEGEIEDARIYMTKLEQGNEEARAYIAKLEQDSAAVGEYVAHLEKDIQELKTALEQERTESRAYIEHLETDIAAMKNKRKWFK